MQALATAAAFLIPQIRQIRSEQRQARAEEREFDTRVEVELAFNDALEPVVRLLGELAQETDHDQRERRRAQMVPLVLTTTAQLTGQDRVRACWFALDPGPPERLQPQESLGRAGPVTTVFARGTPGGDAALDLVTDQRPAGARRPARRPAGPVAAGRRPPRTGAWSWSPSPSGTSRTG